jgi:hypothetical protein
MSLLDRVRRVFATQGSDPPFKEDEPLNFGAGVIKRLKLQNNYAGYNIKKYEPHLGKASNIYECIFSRPNCKNIN